MTQKFSSTVELGNVTLTLRRDLRFTLQSYGSESCYLVEDEKNGRYFRIGLPEYSFISLLDGTTTVRDAIAQMAGVLGSDAFTATDAAAICKWLVDGQLAYSAATEDPARMWEQVERSMRRRRWQRINPLVLKIPLLRPDRWLAGWSAVLGGWFSRSGFVVWLAVVLAASYQLVTHWHQLPVQETRILAPMNLLCMAIAFCIVKVVHELSHGIACRRLGGHVREAGVMLILLAPVPYVDVTSAWRFSSKFHRILVSFAGIYTELFLAAIATLTWIHTPAGVINQQAYNVMVMASLTTVLFNANPLMRFDGYYILADFVEIPNLYSVAQQYLLYLGRRYVAGAKARVPNMSAKRLWFIRVYGVSTLCWRVLVSASILLAATVLLEGVGIVLAILAGIAWVGVPLARLTKYLARGNGTERPNLWQFSLVTGSIAVIVGGLALMPEPFGVTAPGLVTYVEPAVVRAPYDGFIQEIAVVSGQSVDTGMMLGRMQNRELEVDARGLRLEEKKSLLNSYIFQNDRDLAAMQAEQKRTASLKLQADTQEKRLGHSTLTAPRAGTIVGRDLESLAGTFAREGEEVLTIADEGQKELKIYIAQTEVDKFHQFVGQPVRIVLRTPASPRCFGKLVKVDPGGSISLDDPALSAEHGGPLAVYPRPATDRDSNTKQVVELLEPRFTGRVALSPEAARQLRAGQVGSVRLSAHRGTAGQVAFRTIRNWMEQKINRK